MRRVIKLLDTLFPRSEREAVSLVLSDTLPPEVVEDTDVSVHEVIGLVKKRPYRNAAPGPDNIKAAVWKKVPGIVLYHLASLFTSCLRTGIFPRSWKRAILVLIPKGTGAITPNESVKARPICLLDDVSKVLESYFA